MKIDRRFSTRCGLLLLPLVILASYATAQSKSSRYACSEPSPAQLCNASNTCGSGSTPCTVDVKRTANAASSTASIPNAKSVAKKAGCYKYSAGACMSGAIYGMCGTANAELIIFGGN